MNKKELKRNEKFKNKKSMKNCSNLISNHQPLISDHNGITLIALVITIIVMLILVGVTVTVALNGGLFNQAKVATKNTEVEKQKEKELSRGRIKIGDIWYDSYEDYINNTPSENQSDEPAKWEEGEDGNIMYEGKTSGLKIGDYVDYTPIPATTTYSKDKLGESYTGYDNAEDLTTEDLKWRILGVDKNGCLILISNKPTSKLIYFQNAKGYNNGVYILNDICATLYSNIELGINARSLTIEDVEAGFDASAITARNDYMVNEIQYKQPKTYTTNLQYPVLYAEENGSGIGVTEDKVKTNGIDGSVAHYNASQLTEKLEKKESFAVGIDDGKENKTLTCTQTYYYLSSPACKDKNFYDMIFKTGTAYWLASRFVYCTSSYATFGLRGVSGSSFAYYSRDLFYTSGGYGSNSNFLRPVVSLGANFKVEPCDGLNDLENPHKIKVIDS